MPVTIQVAEHDANPVRENLWTGHKGSQDVLEKLSHKNASDVGPILVTAIGQQTSLPDPKLKDTKVTVQDNGLVRAVYYAYAEHYHLVLRPEDIWFAILTQFSYYVNANSEELRSSFVAHEGKKGLILQDPGQADMGLMCRNMTKLIDENIVDPELRKWILPSFTTTTINDEVVAAVIMMGTLKKYFNYVFDCTTCGIPSVTLLGAQSDWEDIQQRIEKLSTYGKEPARFCEMLRPVLHYMVASFTLGPEDPQIVDFWSRIIDRRRGSGMDYLTGWMVAFCFWDEDGKCLAGEGLLERLSPTLLLDLPCHWLSWSKIPCAFVSVPVTYLDLDGDVFSTKLLAGHVGFESTPKVDYDSINAQERGGPGVSNEDQKELTNAQGESVSELSASTTPQLDTIRPLTGWWMYEVKGGMDTGKSRGQFYQEKMANDWNGQASTGVVHRDEERLRVHQGLPNW